MPQNQSASVLGNVGITVPAPGVLAGATEPDGDAISVTPVVAGTSAHGGTFDIAADGMYDFTPAPGYTGSDSFPFQLCDSTDLSVCATGTVNLTVSGEIWFVDASAPAGGNGQLASPFNCLTGTGCFSGADDGAANHPKAGDSVFLYSGSYSGGLTLLNSQRLIGQGAVPSLATVAGVIVPPNSNTLPSTGGTNPTVTASAASTNGINLASGNTLDGFGIGNTTAFHIAGTSFGTLTVADVALSGTGGALNLATGTLAATFSSIASTSSPGAGITLSSSVAGTLTATNGTTVSGSTAQCILVSGSTVDASFGNTSCSGGTDGISLQGISAGSRSFGTLSVSANSGIGFFDNGGGTTNVTGATTITNPTGTGVEIENASTGPVTFAGVTVNKGSTAGTGVSLSGTNSGQTFGFGSLSVTTSSGTALSASGGGTISTSGGTISATGGSAIVVNGVAFGTGSTVASASSSGGTTPGMSLTGASGAMSITGGSIAGNSSSAAFLVSGGTANFSYGGSITQANSQRVVDVEGATGGTVSLGGAVNGNSSTGVFLSGNTGATVSFSGAVTLSTGSSTAFTATGGGTVTATGSGSTITTTTATAVNVSSTNIGASGLKFQSISSNGDNPGISLSSTGTSGGLTVTGTGAAASGGTVQNSTGDGISLSSTTNPSFTDMLVENNGSTSPGGAGITGSNVNGLTLSSSTVSGNGTAANLSGQNNPTPDNDGLDFLGGLTGTVTISNSAVTNSADNGLQITDSAGSLNLTITGSTFSGGGSGLTNNLDPLLGDGVEVLASGPTNATVSVNGSTFTNNQGYQFDFQPSISSTGTGSGTNSITFNANTLSNPTGLGNGGGVNIQASGSSTNSFDVKSNNIQGAQRNAISLANDGTTQLSGTVDGNTVGSPSVSCSGSVGGDDVAATTHGSATSTLAITNNKLYQYDNPAGIGTINGQGSGTMNLTITGNTIADPVPATVTCPTLGGPAGALWGLWLNSGTASGDTSTTSRGHHRQFDDRVRAERGRRWHLRFRAG